MARVTRRDCLQGSVGALAASTLIANVAHAATKPISPTELGGPLRPTPKERARIQFAHVAGPGNAKHLRLMKQIGVNYAIAGVQGALMKVRREDYVATLRKIQAEFAEEGITIAGVESHPVPAEKIKLGVEGRDEEIENYKAAIDALGQVGIRVLCYNWMAGLGWYRTRSDVKERGGALTTEFDLEAAKAQGPTQWGEVSEEKLWANLEYFLKRVIPVAEKARVNMALHPDDPPLSPLRGIGRILTSAANYRRVLAITPSPVHGITFCQANFKAMGEDLEALIKEWCAQKKIFFVHYRDIKGTRQHFVETFHDNGPTDMARVMRLYHECGFAGPIRPDHAPTLESEANDHPGYAFMGQMLGFGYMKGVMDGLGYPYE